MAKESRYDSYELIPPDIGLWENRSPVDDSMERFASCVNFVLTEKKSLRTRSGFSTKIGDTIAGGRVRKIWSYETFAPASTAVLSYQLASVEDSATGLYSLIWIAAGGVAWATVTALRSCNSSTRVHMIVFSRGLAYVKSFPDPVTTSEKLGTVILDGTGGSIVTKPWGLLGPSTPVHLSGAITMLTASVTATATTLNVTSTASFPAAPFTIWVGTEQMNVTAKAATTFTVTRAYGATLASEHADMTVVRYYDWAASDHQVIVKFGWSYSYAYKSITGAISNRAPIEYNPDLMPSNTLAFLDMIPKMTLVGDADTTNIPTIVVYRSTDGGGDFYLLEEIANPGAGAFTYYDDSFGTGGTSSTYNDPVPDLKIDTFTLSPTLTSNSPPPTVVPPQVIGVDDPTPNSYAMANHSRRIFIAVANYLVFSAFEELRSGIPEEAFPTDLEEGGANYQVFNDVIVGLVSDNESLWIFTTKATYRMFGSTKDAFYVTKVFDVGARQTELNATAASSNGNIAFIANSGAIYMITDNGNTIDRISDPMPLTGGQAITSSRWASLYFYKTATQEYLFLASTAYPTEVTSEIYLYDVQLSKERRKPMWISRWTIGGIVTAFAATEANSSLVTGVFISIGTTGSSIVTQLRENNLVAPTDLQINGTQTPVQAFLYTMPIRVPPGNHVNTFNRPTRDVKSTRVFTFSYPTGGDYAAPLVYFNHDNMGGSTQLTSHDPPRIQYESPGSYSIHVYSTDIDCYRIQLSIFSESGKYLELYGFVVEFEPHYTATEV